jgi:hypothetical protein
MKNPLRLILTALAATLLAGCGTAMVHSDVMAVHEWKPEMQGQPYAFEHSATQTADAEYRGYENMVRGELGKLGMKEAGPTQKPALIVRVEYESRLRDARLMQTLLVDPFLFNSGYFGPRWRVRYGSLYDPVFAPPPVYLGYQGDFRSVFQRVLHIVMTSTADAKNIYEVTVISEGKHADIGPFMPYLVSSAFNGFPGTSGAAHSVDMEMKPDTAAH